MSKLTQSQIFGALLLCSVVLVWVPIPYIQGKVLGSLIAAAIGVYLLFFK